MCRKWQETFLLTLYNKVYNKLNQFFIENFPFQYNNDLILVTIGVSQYPLNVLRMELTSMVTPYFYVQVPIVQGDVYVETEALILAGSVIT